MPGTYFQMGRTADFFFTYLPHRAFHSSTGGVFAHYNRTLLGSVADVCAVLIRAWQITTSSAGNFPIENENATRLKKFKGV